MNIYVVIEGEKAAKKIYQKWISLVNKELSSVDYLQDLRKNNYFIFSGQGQPLYWERVDRAVEDVNKISGIDRLVISLDSEDDTYEEKLSQAKSRVEKVGCVVDVKYIIQHFCLETWLLGNNNIFHKKTKNNTLKDYYQRFDILGNDPENLPSYKAKSMNRAQFAYSYLRIGIMEKYYGEKFYSKHNAGIALEETYFNRVKYRCVKVNHIKSFHDFLDAFTY